MLIKMEARSAQGSLLSLPFDDISEGFSVRDITGIDPVKATIVSSGYATQDGEQYHSSRREKRNIVLKLGLEIDYANTSGRKLRDRLYGYFMPKSEVALRFYSDDEPTVNISGRVESFDAPPFSVDPEAAISILCMNPDFVENGDWVKFQGNTVSDLTEVPLTYTGSVETGFRIRVRINRTLTEFSVKVRPGDNVIRSMDISGSFQSGDVVDINTIPGSKGVYLTRGTTKSSLLYGLSPYSPWADLWPGVNNIRVVAAGAAIPYTIEYMNKYGGL